MFNNSVKHKSAMVGDRSSRRGGGGGNGIILTARIYIEKCYFPDRKCLTSPCAGES